MVEVNAAECNGTEKASLDVNDVVANTENILSDVSRPSKSDEVERAVCSEDDVSREPMKDLSNHVKSNEAESQKDFSEGVSISADKGLIKKDKEVANEVLEECTSHENEAAICGSPAAENKLTGNVLSDSDGLDHVLMLSMGNNSSQVESAVLPTEVTRETLLEADTEFEKIAKGSDEHGTKSGQSVEVALNHETEAAEEKGEIVIVQELTLDEHEINITPIGTETSYKGYDSEQLRKLIQSRKNPEANPKPHPKPEPKSKVQVAKSKANNSDKPEASTNWGDKNAFTRTLMQFLDGSRNFFSPNSKSVSITEDKKEEAPESKAKKSLLNAMNESAPVVEENKTSQPQTSGFAFLDLFKPKNQQKNATLPKDKPRGPVKTEKPVKKTFSRRALMDLSRSGCLSQKPGSPMCVDVAVIEAIEFGSRIPYKVSPPTVLSRDFRAIRMDDYSHSGDFLYVI